MDINRLTGGERGIRTLGTRKGTTVFETVPIDHSGTSPWRALIGTCPGRRNRTRRTAPLPGATTRRYERMWQRSRSSGGSSRRCCGSSSRSALSRSGFRRSARGSPRRPRGLAGERLDLAGDDGKALAGIAGAGRLHGASGCASARAIKAALRAGSVRWVPSARWPRPPGPG